MKDLILNQNDIEFGKPFIAKKPAVFYSSKKYNVTDKVVAKRHLTGTLRRTILQHYTGSSYGL